MADLRVIEGSGDLPVFFGKTGGLHGIGEEEVAAFAGLEVVEGVGGRIRRARESLSRARGQKFTQEDLAQLVGVTKAAVTQWENGYATPDRSRRAAIAAALECSEEWLFAEARPMAAHKSGEPAYLKRSSASAGRPQIAPRGGLTLPVRATTASDKGDFRFVGQVTDYRRRPPALLDSQMAYCFAMRGQSMAPVFEEGRIVYVDPGRAAQIGDYAVIEMVPGEDEHSHVIIRRIIYRTPDSIEIWQATPDSRTKIGVSTVAYMHRILIGEDLI